MTNSLLRTLVLALLLAFGLHALAIDWGVYGAPETFLIGPDGTVLFKHIAPMTMEVWTKEFLPRIEAANASAGTTPPAKG